MKTLLNFEDFILESAAPKTYTKEKRYDFEVSFYLRDTSDYTTSDKKFGSDMMGKKGGDAFDFEVDNVKIYTDNVDGEDDEVTKVELTGDFKTDLRGLKNSELSNKLMEYIGDVVVSYTKKHPQMFRVRVKKIDK